MRPFADPTQAAAVMRWIPLSFVLGMSAGMACIWGLASPLSLIGGGIIGLAALAWEHHTTRTQQARACGKPLRASDIRHVRYLTASGQLAQPDLLPAQAVLTRKRLGRLATLATFAGVVIGTITIGALSQTPPLILVPAGIAFAVYGSASCWIALKYAAGVDRVSELHRLHTSPQPKTNTPTR